jgi:TonB-dependent receptor
MQASHKHWLAKFLVGTSALSLMGAAQAAMAQEAPADNADGDEIVVTGIRASLSAAADIKRDAVGVVDAISAEDIGKFPDTNLAESLQRITGVSIDRSNGEGSTVTVRGFGPDFNLVTLNGRQMPTAIIGDGGSAPSSRSFDFANLASEGVSAVEVYKSGRATIESGGIGSTINIRTPRPLDKPGMYGSLSAKAVYDSSRNNGNPVTPEISGIFSTTFADDTIGILITGSYQKRKASENKANVGWRDGYLGSENNWGSLAQPGDPRFPNITNRPDPTDVYQVPQNASYDLNDINRERINGQAVLQWRPADSLVATLDYTYSRNTVTTRNSNVGIWFNHEDTSSAWTDGPVAGPIFYTERFGAPPAPPSTTTLNGGKDLSYSGALTDNRAENRSIGFNLDWKGDSGFSFELDAHHSTATVKPVNRFGSSMSVGNAIFGVRTQTVNFENDLPVISYAMHPGIDPLNAALIQPTGNAFRAAYFRDEINQVQLRGQYDVEEGFLDSIDFGVSYVENKVRSAFGTIQNDTWGGAGPAADIPDDIFTLETLPDKFPGLAQPG